MTARTVILALALVAAPGFSCAQELPLELSEEALQELGGTSHYAIHRWGSNVGTVRLDVAVTPAGLTVELRADLRLPGEEEGTLEERLELSRALELRRGRQAESGGAVVTIEPTPDGYQVDEGEEGLGESVTIKTDEPLLFGVAHRFLLARALSGAAAFELRELIGFETEPEGVRLEVETGQAESRVVFSKLSDPADVWTCVRRDGQLVEVRQAFPAADLVYRLVTSAADARRDLDRAPVPPGSPRGVVATCLKGLLGGDTGPVEAAFDWTALAESLGWTEAPAKLKAHVLGRLKTYPESHALDADALEQLAHELVETPRGEDQVRVTLPGDGSTFLLRRSEGTWRIVGLE
jgi:hypothetical protein